MTDSLSLSLSLSLSHGWWSECPSSTQPSRRPAGETLGHGSTHSSIQPSKHSVAPHESSAKAAPSTSTWMEASQERNRDTGLGYHSQQGSSPSMVTLRLRPCRTLSSAQTGDSKHHHGGGSQIWARNDSATKSPSTPSKPCQTPEYTPEPHSNHGGDLSGHPSCESAHDRVAGHYSECGAGFLQPAKLVTDHAGRQHSNCGRPRERRNHIWRDNLRSAGWIPPSLRIHLRADSTPQWKQPDPTDNRGQRGKENYNHRVESRLHYPNPDTRKVPSTSTLARNSTLEPAVA